MTTTIEPTASAPTSTRSPRARTPTPAVPEALAVLAARTAVALEAALTGFLAADHQNLGHFETQAAHAVQELLRTATQRAAQAKADATPPRCPVCGQPLTRCSAGHARTFQTRFGDITLHRTRGYCKRCHKWRTPPTPRWAWKTPLATRPPSKRWPPWPPANCPSPKPASCSNTSPACGCPRPPSTAKPKARANAPNASAPNSISKPRRSRSNLNWSSNPTS